MMDLGSKEKKKKNEEKGGNVVSCWAAYSLGHRVASAPAHGTERFLPAVVWASFTPPPCLMGFRLAQENGVTRECLIAS